MNGCYSNNEMDFIEIINEIFSLNSIDPSIAIALGFNRDLFL